MDGRKDGWMERGKEGGRDQLITDGWIDRWIVNL